MNVKLLSHTPEPEKLIAAAAKLCYSASDIEDVYDQKENNYESNKKFIKMLRNLGHESPLEHISFTFGIEGVSRAFLAQITRHRIASYSVQSQRYVNKTNFEYIIPPEISKNREAIKIYLQTMDLCQKAYKNLSNILQKSHKNDLILRGYDEKKAESVSEKRAIEDARFVLPNACDTKIICTFNCRSLLNFFKLRCCNRAQWEIRMVAQEMFKLVYKVAPNIFENAGPSCIKGACIEGKMSCGKADEVRKFFNNLMKI